MFGPVQDKSIIEKIISEFSRKERNSNVKEESINNQISTIRFFLDNMLHEYSPYRIIDLENK